MVVKTTVATVAGWGCVIFGLFAVVLSWQADGWKLPLFFLVFATLGVYLILYSGTLKMNSEIISYQTSVSHHQILWSEVKRIELDEQGGNIVFVGDDKQLAASGWQVWSGKDKSSMLALLDAKIKTENIEVAVTAKAMVKGSKNTKVTQN